MKARCPCNTPPPDPDCERCGGDGYFEARFPDEDEVEALWIGRCSACGSENGGHFQQKGKPSPRDDPYEQKWPPPCINEDCPSEHVEWVKADDIEICWIAVCPICNTGHWANHLQLMDGPEPTPADQARTCPKEGCGHSPMSWVRHDDLE